MAHENQTTLADLEASFWSGNQEPLIDYEIGDEETLAAGEIVALGTGMVGISPSDVPRSTSESGAQRFNALATKGIWRIRKAAGGGVTFTAGDIVQWDDTADTAVVSPDADADFVLGTAVQDAADGDDFVLVAINELHDLTGVTA